MGSPLWTRTQGFEHAESTPIRSSSSNRSHGRWDVGGGTGGPSNVSSALTTPAAGMAYLRSPSGRDSDWESPYSTGSEPLAAWGVDLGDGTVVDPSKDQGYENRLSSRIASFDLSEASSGPRWDHGGSIAKEGSFGGFKSIQMAEPDPRPPPFDAAVVVAQPRVTSTLFDSSPIRPQASSQAWNLYDAAADDRSAASPAERLPAWPSSGVATQQRRRFSSSEVVTSPSWQSPIPHYQIARMLQQGEADPGHGRRIGMIHHMAPTHHSSLVFTAGGVIPPGVSVVVHGGRHKDRSVSGGIEVAGGPVAATRQATAQLLFHLQTLNSRVQASTWRPSI